MKTLLLSILFGACGTVFAESLTAADYVGKDLTVRTNKVGENTVVAVTGDFQFFAIKCEENILFPNQAYLIFPNSKGVLTVDDFKNVIRKATVLDRSRYAPMSAKAEKQICNAPNGMYVLRVDQADRSYVVNVISGQAFSPEGEAELNGP